MTTSIQTTANNRPMPVPVPQRNQNLANEREQAINKLITTAILPIFLSASLSLYNYSVKKDYVSANVWGIVSCSIIIVDLCLIYLLSSKQRH